VPFRDDANSNLSLVQQADKLNEIIAWGWWNPSTPIEAAGRQHRQLQAWPNAAVYKQSDKGQGRVNMRGWGGLRSLLPTHDSQHLTWKSNDGASPLEPKALLVLKLVQSL
jgi:hypothetical protein